jgi:hypothetical protein
MRDRHRVPPTMKTPNHPWNFRQRLRARAFGWRGSSLAITRLKEALAEVKAVYRAEPALAAEGAVLLLERIWPAVQAVDSSSGSLGNAVGKTVHELLDLLLTVSADDRTWERWRERLWTAVEEDGVDYLSEVVERWGELCRTPERASRAADDWVSVVWLSWSPGHRGYFRGTTGCLSCLLAAGRYQEFQDLIEPTPFALLGLPMLGDADTGRPGRGDRLSRCVSRAQ